MPLNKLTPFSFKLFYGRMEGGFIVLVILILAILYVAPVDEM